MWTIGGAAPDDELAEALERAAIGEEAWDVFAQKCGMPRASGVGRWPIRSREWEETASGWLRQPPPRSEEEEGCGLAEAVEVG